MNTNDRAKVVRVILTGFLGLSSLAAFGLMFVGFIWYYLALPPSPTGKTTGFVAEVRTTHVASNKYGSTRYECDVTFKVGEKPYTIYGTGCGASWEGSDVTVVYQLSNPENATVDRGRGIALVFGAIGFVLGAYPFYVLIGFWKGRRNVLA